MFIFSVLSVAELEQQRIDLAHWLHTYLDEYGDEEKHILAALDYAASPQSGKGGVVALAHQEGKLVACSVVNHTGMGGYIPEHQLVYLAVQRDIRGQGLGKKMLAFTLEQCPGAMALHVEYDNPARFLYAKLGFVNKYAEMRRPTGG